MFAVIKTGGKQYKVATDDVVTIERLEGETGSTVTFENVLMVGNGEAIDVGVPLVDGASVVGEIVEHGRGPKIIIFKKRRRHNYRRRNGHRQDLTTVRITEILTGGAKPSAKPKAKATPAADTAPAEKPADAAPAATAEVGVAPLFTAPEGAADDLKKISGVGPVLEGKLNALGITTYAQIAAFTPEDIERVDASLNFKGRIERDDWLAQAASLASGSDSDDKAE